MSITCGFPRKGISNSKPPEGVKKGECLLILGYALKVYWAKPPSSAMSFRV